MEKLNSFYKMLKNNAEKYPNKEAIIYDTMTISYSKLFEDVCKKALHLKRFTGNRIALYGPSSYRWIVNMFGIILAGKDVMLVSFCHRIPATIYLKRSGLIMYLHLRISIFLQIVTRL